MVEFNDFDNLFSSAVVRTKISDSIRQHDQTSNRYIIQLLTKLIIMEHFFSLCRLTVGSRIRKDIARAQQRAGELIEVSSAQMR